jgi:hypothetical protein
LKVLQFPLPETQKNLLQFIGLANYFRDHVPNMTEMVQPLRKLIPLKKYKGSGKLIWTPEAIAAFEFCQVAISNCQELYFLEDTATPILLWRIRIYGKPHAIQANNTRSCGADSNPVRFATKAITTRQNIRQDSGGAQFQHGPLGATFDKKTN